ncbi:MAG: hypothetical protein HKO53_07840 [Gemmatimonadetes bacterium]|nr:hypothetical protein [Gemmatimonadota bacterium]NNM32964.1 hypothetical protein [Gemmatimonadota bacterium]
MISISEDRWTRVGRACLCAGVLACSATGLGAQESATVTTLGLSVATDYFANQDALVSPRRHDGVGVGPGAFTIAVERPGSRHGFGIGLRRLDIAAGPNFSYTIRGGQARTIDSEVTLVDAFYSYMRRLDDGRWWLGGAASLNLAHSEYEFGAGAAEGFLYVASLQAVGGRTLMSEEDRSLAVRVRLPLLAWVARPPFSTVDEERLQSSNDFFHRLGTGEVVLPGDYSAVAAIADYRQALSDHLGLSVAGRLEYVRHSDQGQFISARAGIDIGLSVQWGGDL